MPDHTWIVAPVKQGWELHQHVTIASLDETLDNLSTVWNKP